MTIDELYRFVQFVSNKEQRGYVRPTEFNLLAKRGQLDLIKDRVGKTSKDSQAEGYKVTSALFDELYPVIVTARSLATSNSVYIFPDDYLYFLGFSAGTPARAVEIISHGELYKRRDSSLVRPSPDFPVGVIGGIIGTNVAQGVRLYTPTQSTTPTGLLDYVKEPHDPVWNFVVVNDVEVYSATGSVQLELPESTHMEIAHRILGYIGVNLRESDMVQYSTAITKE